MTAFALRRRASLLGAVAGTDHKKLGVHLGAVAFLFFLAGGVLALVMRTELAHPGLQVTSLHTYNELFTMHGSTMIYLFVTPVALAMGLYLVPLQIGAADVAGARWSLAGLALIVLAGIAMWSGFLMDGGAGRAAWPGFDPLSDSVNTPGEGQDVWVFGVFLAATGSWLIGGTILATILRRRAPGMTLLRMPVFTWTMLVTCLMVLFAFPVLMALMALLFVERQWGGIFSSSPQGAITYQHMFWFYGHPVVYVMFFPFLGATAEALAVFSSRRFFGYKGFVAGLLVFTSLSMSVWAHHMFTVPGVTVKYFSLTSTLLAVPAGLEYFALVGTLKGGRIRLTTSMWFALAFVMQFLVGGLSGIWVASAPLDYHANNSYFVVAHFHYTLMAGSIFGFFAGVYLWWPKVTGRLLGEKLGKWHFWLLAVGTNLTFAPQFALGQEGMTRRIADYPASTGWEGLNSLSTLGSYLIGLSVLLFVVNVARTRRRPADAGPDPWGGQSLEWATSSPPPRFNFTSLPPVKTYAPLMDLREEAHALPGQEREGAL